MHLKGVRFGFPLMKRIGLLKHHETYRVAWNRHPGVEIHYVLKGDIAWELKGRDRPLAISGGFFGIVPANARHRALGNKGTPAVRLGVIFENPSPEMARGTPFSPDDLKRIFRRFKENGGWRQAILIAPLSGLAQPDGRALARERHESRRAVAPQNARLRASLRDFRHAGRTGGTRQRT